MVMGLLSPRGSQFTTTTVAGTGCALIMTRERCLLDLEFFFFFVDLGLGSWSTAGLAGCMSFEFLFVFHP